MQRAFELDIPQTLEDICDPTRLALIVYDMQVGIVKQIENGQQITDRVLQVLEAARKAGIRVVFTRHMSLPKELIGGISVPHGDGLAKGEIGSRGQALVLAGRAGIPSDPGDKSTAK
jgi:nicotinamidase-related amidase